MADTPELIRVKFDGKLASLGQLHFYEYSRSQYALARFIATIEHFRRTEKVAERITSDANVDVLVRSPVRGSFIEDIIVASLQEGTVTAILVPLSALISYVWHLISSRMESSDQIIQDLAKIRMVEDVAKITGPSIAGPTPQISTQALKDIAEGDRADARDGLELVRWSLETSNVAVGRLDLDRSALLELERELSAEEQRQLEFKRYDAQLSQIDEETLNKLTSRLRPLISDIGLPLRKSANSVSIGHGTDGETYAYITPGVIANIQDKVSETTTTQIIGHIKSYDRDAGVGKVVSSELPKVLNFVVPRRDRARLLEGVLQAMRDETSIITCRRVIDKSGQPTSLILTDIASVDSLDDDD